MIDGQDVLKDVLSTESGRRFIYDLLWNGGVFTPFSDEALQEGQFGLSASQMAYKSGRRDALLEINNRVLSVCPNFYGIMSKDLEVLSD